MTAKWKNKHNKVDQETSNHDDLWWKYMQVSICEGFLPPSSPVSLPDPTS